MFPIFIILFSPKSLRKISATSRGLHPLANALCLDLQRHHLNFSMASPSKNGCRANSLSKVGLIDPQGTIKRLFTTCCGEILQFSSSLWKLWYELLKVIISSPAWLTNWSYIYIYLATCDVIWHLWKQETTIEVLWNVSLSVVLISRNGICLADFRMCYCFGRSATHLTLGPNVVDLPLFVGPTVSFWTNDQDQTQILAISCISA